MPKKTKLIENNESILDVIIRYCTGAYICAVIIFLPLYLPNGYSDPGNSKYDMWLGISMLYFVFIIVLLLVRGIKGLVDSGLNINAREILTLIKNNVSSLDCFMIAYLFICVLSSFTSGIFDFVWIGAMDWNMGLRSQICFVLGYFFISRTWQYSNVIMRGGIVASIIVYLLEIVMRFGMDPMNVYPGLTDWEVLNFVSTIGQTSWYSSYLAVMFPICIISYAIARTMRGRVISAICVCIGFMSLVTQHSDSAYIALTAFMFVFMWLAFDSNEMMKRFIEVVIMMFASFKFTGILQIIFADVATKLDGISVFLSQGALTWLGLVVFAVIYLVLFNERISSRLNTKNIDVRKFSIIRVILLIILLLSIVFGITYIVLNTMGLMGALSIQNNYLYFSWDWGEYRGINWRETWNAFVKENWYYKLFGNGPDTYGPTVYEFLDQNDPLVYNFFLNDKIVSCAHNEWLNMLITEGIFGLIAYVGIFVSCFIRCINSGKKDMCLYGIAMAIASYMGHNVFCYQQVVCTSLIFVFMGIAEAGIRNGHTDWDAREEEDIRNGVRMKLL